MLKELCTAALLGGLMLPAVARAEAIPGPAVGQPAPDFTATTLSGKSVRLADFRGKTLVLNFWATWCPPCRAETPDMIASYRTLRSSSVAFLGLDSTEQAPIIRAFVAAKGLPYPVAIDTEKKAVNAYDVRGIPTTFVIDANGIVRARFVDVISRPALAQFVSDAKAGRNGVIASAVQRKIDAALDSAALNFTGEHDAVFAQAKAALDAVNNADKLMGTADSDKGELVDYLRVRAEEAAVLDRAATAVGPVARSDDDRKLLYRMQGDLATDREQWPQAASAYSQSLALDPKDSDSLNGLAFAYYEQKDWANEIAAYQRLVALSPDFDTYVSIAKAYAQLKDYPNAIAANKMAVSLAEKSFNPTKNDSIVGAAYTWLYLGRTYAATGDRANARDAFANTLKYGQMFKPGSVDYAKYTEEAQEAEIALNLDQSGKTAVSLAPWTGPDLPGSVASTIKYRLVVASKPGAALKLRAAGLSKGWIASFCSDKVCSPMKYSVVIPSTGVKIIEFQLIRNENTAPARTSAQVVVTDGGGQATSSAVVASR